MCHQASLTPAYSPTEISWNIEILYALSLHIFSREGMTKVLIRPSCHAGLWLGCLHLSKSGCFYSKTCLKRQLKKKTKIGFQDGLSLNAGHKYCRKSILQYFRPSLSYHMSLRPLFCLFLSDRFRQVLL